MTAAIGLVGTALAGCGGDGDGGDGDGGDDGNGGDGGHGGGDGTEVAAGPGGDLVFDPETVTISTGETVTWTFESPSHNVSFDPDHHDDVSIPDGVDPFASVEGAFDTNEEGATWSHTFETAGEYQYVCVPHAASGMQGTVVVE
jgi:plastocyanin